MKPFLFYIGHAGVPSFFFMIMLGTLVATFVALWFARRDKVSEINILDLAIIAIVLSMVGARVFHIFFEAPDYYWKDPIRVFYFWQGGFVSLGAFIASITGWIIYLKVKKLNTLQYFDLMANATPVVILFVRLGCFLNGCCYGKPATNWSAVTFTNPSSTACLMHYCNMPVYPTQIFFMINAVIMFVFLFIVRKYKKFHGQIVASFLMYEGFSRFFIEFFRGDVDRGLYFNNTISTGQIVMILFFTGGLIIYKTCKKNTI